MKSRHLSPEESRDLAIRWQESVRAEAPDYEVRNALVMGNIGLAFWIARRVAHRHKMERKPLEQAAVLGLIRACDTFDPVRSTFSSYAMIWAKKEVRQETECRTIVRVPKWAIYQGEGRFAACRDVAFSMTFSLSRPSPREGPDLSEAMAVPPYESPGDDDEELPGLREAIARLTEKERLIIAMRHGLGGAMPATLKEIGSDMGVSRERIRQIEAVAHRKIRAFMGGRP